MRPRRRRSHSRRQTGVTFNQGGGVVLDNGAQGGVAGDNANQNQQPLGTTTVQQVFSTGHVQPGHHAVPSSGSQPSPFPTVPPLASASHVLSTNAPPARTSGSLASSALQSSLSTARPTVSSNSSLPGHSGTTTTVTSASQLSASSSSIPTVSASSHSIQFYVGIGFGAVVAMAFVISFAAWLLRMRSKGTGCCFGGKHDEDVENQDPGLGLGLYLDKSRDGFDSQKVHSTPFLSSTYAAPQRSHPYHPAISASSISQHGYPSAMIRPTAPHTMTDKSTQAPDRPLGPLRIRNYVSGDFPSSCDEAAPSPKTMRHVGAPWEPQPDGTPRYLGSEGQGSLKPWAPLNVKPRTRKQVNMTQSPSRKYEATSAVGEEQNYYLPTPPFGLTRPRRDYEGASPNGWGDSLRSSIHAALSRSSGDDENIEVDDSPAPPGSYSRADRWRAVLSSQKHPVGDAVTSESVSRTLANPETDASNHPLSSYGQGLATFDSIGLGLRMEERLDGGTASAPSTRPPTVSKERATERGGGSKRSLGNVKPKMMFRQDSLELLLPSMARRPAKRSSKCMKRSSVATRASMATRGRPEFLRQPTAASVTSFSSEASEPRDALTEEELRAKRTMMLRARRKRGMGASSGTGKARLSERVTQTKVSRGAEPSEG